MNIVNSDIMYLKIYFIDNIKSVCGNHKHNTSNKAFNC